MLAFFILNTRHSEPAAVFATVSLYIFKSFLRIPKRLNELVLRSFTNDQR
jgi:hypothetical protein